MHSADQFFSVRRFLSQFFAIGTAAIAMSFSFCAHARERERKGGVGWGRTRYYACYQNTLTEFGIVLVIKTSGGVSLKVSRKRENHRPQRIRGSDNSKYCARNRNVLLCARALDACRSLVRFVCARIRKIYNKQRRNEAGATK